MATPDCNIAPVQALKTGLGAIQIYSNLIAADRGIVPGATSLKMPVGYDRDKAMIKQAGAIGSEIVGAPFFEPVPFKLDWYHQDETQKELYDRGMCQEGPYDDMWIYAALYTNDRTRDIIFIPNNSALIYGGAGPGAGLDVGSFKIPEEVVNTPSWYKVDGMFVQNARFIKADVQIEDTLTDITFTATGIARATGDFTTQVSVGDKIYIDDLAATGLNHGKIVTVDTVVALLITVVEVGLLVVDVASPTTWLRAGKGF